MVPSLESRLEALLAQAEHLPTLPSVALEVVRLCRAEETTLDDLARALSADPALAARLMRFANSSLYSPGEEVRTLQRATLVLGLKTVQLMALSFSLVAAVPRTGVQGAFDYARYWRRSLVRAVSARTLAGAVAPTIQDEAFLVGLLAEIGQVVLARVMAEEYAYVLEESAAAGDGWPTAALERAQLGFDHHDVGGALLRSWQLPPVLSQTVENVETPERLAPETSGEVMKLAHVLALASRTADLFTKGSGADRLAELRDLAQRWFTLDAAGLDTLLACLDAPLQETAALLEITVLGERSHADILTEAHDELVRRSLGQSRELFSLRTVVDPAAHAPSDPAQVDALTGCASASAFRNLLEHQIRVRLDGNLGRPLGLLRLDLDPGETADERAASEAERALAGLLARLMRKQDLAARLAPGRFAVLLGDATPYGLRRLVERLRRQNGPSVCVGGACLGPVTSSHDGAALLEVVERLLRKAQGRGRDQAEVHPALLRGR